PDRQPARPAAGGPGASGRPGPGDRAQRAYRQGAAPGGQRRRWQGHPGGRPGHRREPLNIAGPAAADEVVAVGRVGRAHGVRGDVFVEPWTDAPEERFADGAVVYAG